MSTDTLIADPTVACASQKAKASTEIEFTQGLPGFEQLQRWELVEHEEVDAFFWLRSCEESRLRLLVVDPRAIVEGYAPRVSRAALSAIAQGEDESPVLLVVVTLHGGGAASVNLRAPIVIFPSAMRGQQVILDDPRWPIRHPLGADSETEHEEGTRRSQECSSSAARSDSHSS